MNKLHHRAYCKTERVRTLIDDTRAAILATSANIEMIAEQIPTSSLIRSYHVET